MIDPFTISVIVPCYNGERFLAEAIDSILGQTRPPEEILIVDDGSTDATAQIARGYEPRVTLIQQDNAGPASARNDGIFRATGSLLAFLDQDDLWLPHKLERQCECLAADPELDICYSHVQRLWSEELEDEAQRVRDQPRGDIVPAYATISMLARRRAFDRVGELSHDLKFGDAIDWALRARDLGLNMLMLDDVLVRHREHHHNLTRQREENADEFLHIVKRTLDRRRGGRCGGTAPDPVHR